MKTAEEVAFDCLYGMHRGSFSRDVFNAVMNDSGDTGEALRKLHRAITKTIKADRAAHAAVESARAIARG